MGFRYELKKTVRPLIDDQEYRVLAEKLKQAREKSAEHEIYYDLEKGESAKDVRKKLAYVASKEKLELRIKKKKNAPTLRLRFTAAE
jgi:hypothetical protein